ncbi:MAG: MMPL family transporter [Myxococcota bacterium]
MNGRSSAFASRLTEFGVRRPGVTLAAAVLSVGMLLVPASRLTSEVGYAGYFGPDDPRVHRLTDFLDEFDSGLHVLVVFGCGETHLCERATDEPALRFVARLQEALDRVPNVRRTTSVLNAAILVGPLEARTVGRRTPDGGYALADGWGDLARRAAQEHFLRNTVISADGHDAGVVVELQSLDSDRVRDGVHGIQGLLSEFERELGSEIYLAGDPVWTVISSDDLSADSTNLTVLMFLVIAGVLWAIFRSVWLMLLPVIAVGALAGAVHGIIGVLGIPMTAILAALPPVLVVIAITASIHLLTAFLQSSESGIESSLIAAASEVGPGCFWAAFTTSVGFASFFWSDLASFRHFGGVAAIGLTLSYLTTFTVLPALVSLRPGVLEHARNATGRGLVVDLLAALQGAVGRRPRFVQVASLVALVGISVGAFRVHYETSFGFGERHFVYRSLRYIEANFRKPMTAELVIDVPEGRRIYDEETLRLLAEAEAHFAREPSTGTVWSFLDFLEDAYRLDSGRSPESFEALVKTARDQMPIVANYEQVSSFWSESAKNGGSEVYLDRARVSVDRAWLDDDTQGPYVVRLHQAVADLNREWGPLGYHIEVEGGLILADLFIGMIRDTQRRSFASALAVVIATLVLLLWGNWRLICWASLTNVLPAAALLGTMGWAAIGIDPANSMVATILIAIAVDDTIHVALRYRSERARGLAPPEAMRVVLGSVGEAVVTSSVCLALGFSVLMFSSWGGLVSFGLLASLGVMLALLCDLLLLPAAMLTGAAEQRDVGT